MGAYVAQPCSHVYAVCSSLMLVTRSQWRVPGADSLLAVYLACSGAWTQLVPGQSLTIEPVLVEGGSTGAHWKWRDGWTLSAVDNSLSAQFEVTVVVRSAEEGGGCEVVTPFLTSWKDEADAVGSV